jgi:hypothetical protein
MLYVYAVYTPENNRCQQFFLSNSAIIRTPTLIKRKHGVCDVATDGVRDLERRIHIGGRFVVASGLG